MLTVDYFDLIVFAIHCAMSKTVSRFFCFWLSVLCFVLI